MKSKNFSKQAKRIEGNDTSKAANISGENKEKTGITKERKFFYIYLTLLFIIGYALIRYVFDKKVFLGGDNTDYFIYGKALAHGEGFVNISVPSKPHVSHFPPGYPFLISLIIRLFSDNPDTIKYFDGLYFLGSVLLLFQIFRKITNNIHLAFVACLLLLVNLNLLQFTTLMMSEASFIFFSTLSIFFFLRIKSSQTFYKEYNFWLFLLSLVFSYHIRDLGLAYLAGVCLYLLYKKNYPLLVATLLGFILLAAPWYVYRAKEGGDGHISLITYKNPLRPELGKINTWHDIADRIGSNAKRYIQKEIPNAIFSDEVEQIQKEQKTEQGSYFLGICLLLGILWGLYCMKEFGVYLFGILAASFAILLIFPEIYTGVRLSLHLIPIYILGLLVGIYTLLKNISTKYQLTKPSILEIVLPLTLGLSIFGFQKGIKNLHQAATLADFTPAFQDYFEVGKWIKANADGKQLIICRKPSLMYYYSENYTGNFKPTTNTNEIIQDIINQKAKYVVLDGLGYGSTMRYLAPAIHSDAEKFKLILTYPTTSLYEVVPENGFHGSIKNGTREGKGFYKWINGDTYDGEWKNNVRNGEGVLTSAQMSYSGTWKDDKIWGKGTVTYADGRKLVGTFVDGQAEGNNKLFLPNGQIILSNWHKNIPSGEGILQDTHGKQVGKGTWINGEFKVH